MVKTMDEVLTSGELSQIIRIGYDMQNINLARLLENVPHIECEIKEDNVDVELYLSLRNPYVKRLPSTRVMQLVPKRVDEKELYEKRKRHKTEFSARRHEIVLDEIRMRNHDIEVHKHYLSEEEEFNVGWIVAAAHWLKEIGPGFYDISKRHHQQLGIGFEWQGMERAVGIVAPNRNGEETYYVAVRSEDFSIEEHMAQYAGGVVDHDTQEVDVEKAEIVRERLNELCKNHFCIVAGKD